jgi:DNA polymerase III subunit delta'
MLAVPAWLDSETSALRAALLADRIPHGLLIHESPGAGGDWLASWVARLVLCSSPEAPQRPCGQCLNCARVTAGQHPDLISIRPIDESRQIRIEQVRELSQELALTSHQGGYKVAVISPADLMNRFAANALLKTLEEPPPRTLLILVATQPSRLPATILSRCQRIRAAAPSRSQALSWLELTRGKGDWNAALAVLGNAPLSVVQSDPALIVATAAEVRRGLEDSLGGRADPVATAERWARAPDLPLRLRCFENWLTERIYGRFAAAGLFTEVGGGTYFQPPETVLNIHQLFELLDEVRDLGGALDTPINRGLALESLLRRLHPVA